MHFLFLLFWDRPLSCVERDKRGQVEGIRLYASDISSSLLPLLKRKNSLFKLFASGQVNLFSEGIMLEGFTLSL
ncbi:predicted protein [Methanosarcina acetivorans C2A]|uniref:Uncharacterized protein n=1 Tax=Methanosarcina acetivorans (strain ATCC 35395 / DSM 2834 / JCM 12185 / C2A) TaxID=188937 RepID=Q8TK96_METAC|nr:predicted protein [Methanosarcina acetivorans C2A]